jgi:hypothetical protein
MHGPLDKAGVTRLHACSPYLHYGTEPVGLHDLMSYADHVEEIRRSVYAGFLTDGGETSTDN